VSNRSSRIHHQGVEKCELLWGQVKRATSLLHHMPRSIKMQIPDTKHMLVMGSMILLQRSAYSCDQLVGWQQIYRVITGGRRRRLAS
jgi:hypothetical protein